jgi:hypothetical protein
VIDKERIINRSINIVIVTSDAQEWGLYIDLLKVTEKAGPKQKEPLHVMPNIGL